MSSVEPRKRGGNFRKAPEGFYTAKQAYTRLGMDRQAFYRNVEAGLIPRFQPPLSKDGFYPKEEIDALADERTVALLQHIPEEERTPTVFRTATPEDADGIYQVTRSLGWQATPPRLRRTWYEVNPEIDHVVVQDGVIMGYINSMAYRDEQTLEDMMAGRKKGWDIRASDIAPFEPGHEYDVFVGLTERAKPEKAARYARYGRRLVLGFREVLEEWAKRGIIIHRLMAHSAEEDGQKFAKLLGFDPVPAILGDRYPRFILDLKASDTPFAERYRKLITTYSQERA